MTKILRAMPLVLAACGGAAGGVAVRPDDMSAAEHRREAARERTASESHLARYAETLPTPFDYAATTPEGEYIFGVPGSDPSTWHLSEAELHSAHAIAHEEAARELERFEAVECAEIPRAMRAGCPVLFPVTAVEDVPDGVRIHFARGTDVGRVSALMRCHLAYARTRGFGEAAACPLYMRGVHIAVASGEAVEVLADGAQTAAAVRRAVRESAIRSPTRR